jgi:hypothetical protein
MLGGVERHCLVFVSSQGVYVAVRWQGAWKKLL